MKNLDVVIAGRYRCVRLIGRGGFAEVYLAEDLRLANRRVALKVLVEHVAYDQDRLQKFRQEAEIIGHLTNPYTVRAFDYGYDEHGRYYIAMEFVQGETLHELLKRQERFAIDRALEISIQLLDALEEAHQMGVIHRDLKPKNIMISPQRQGEMVKVLDFGVARILRQADEEDEWTLVGTATYMAPEQAQGMPVSPASDLYSVGVVLYHMLSGRPPFLSQEDPVAVMIHHATKPVTPLRELRPELDIPEDVDRAVLKALEKQPQYRYQQAGAFREVLERSLAHYLEARYGENEGDSTLSTSITLKDVEEDLRAQARADQALQSSSAIQSGEIRSQAALLEDLRSGSVPSRAEDPMASTIEGSYAQDMSSLGDMRHTNDAYVEEDEYEQPTQRLSGIQEAPERTAVRKAPTGPPRQITDFDLLTPDFAVIEEISVNEQAAGTRSGYYAASGDSLPSVPSRLINSPMTSEKAKTSPRQMAVPGLERLAEEDGDETALSLQGVVDSIRSNPPFANKPAAVSHSKRPAWSEEEIGAEESDEMTFAEDEEILEAIEDDATLKPGVSSEDLVMGAIQAYDQQEQSDPTHIPSNTSSGWASSSEEGGDSTHVGRGPSPSSNQVSSHYEVQASSGGASSGAFVAGYRAPHQNPPLGGTGSSQGVPAPSLEGVGYGGRNGVSAGEYRSQTPPPPQHSHGDAGLKPMHPPISALYPNNGPVMGGAAAQAATPLYPIQPTTVAYPPAEDPKSRANQSLPETSVLPISEVSPPRMPKAASPMQDLLVSGRPSKLRRARDENASTMELKSAFLKRRWFGLIGAVLFLAGLMILLISVGGESEESIAKRRAQQIQAEYLRSLQEGDRAAAEGRFRDALSSYKTALLHKPNDPTATKRMGQVMLDLQSTAILRHVRRWMSMKKFFRAYNELLKVSQQSSLWDERNKVMAELKPSLVAALRDRVRLALRRRQWKQASLACAWLQRLSSGDRLLSRCRRVWRRYPPPKEP